MGIEAKRRGWQLGEIKIDLYKKMTSEGPRKMKSLLLEIFMPFDLDSHKFEALQLIAEDCPVKLNLEESLDIKLNWHQEEFKN